jgi:hypothetical protein
VPNDENRLSPAAKKAARDATRRALRARKKEIARALRADWEDRDPDTYNVLDAALRDDCETQMIPWLLFGLASRAISDLSDETGTSREEYLAALLR